MELDNKIIIYENNDGKSQISVKVENETVWLSQSQLVSLFKSSKSNISEHIKHIFEEDELSSESVVRKFRTTASDGKKYNVDHYNLDLIISVGYRVKSHIATQFRIWATQRLKEYLIKGFTMNDEQLKGNGGGNYWKELLDRIKDIRSSEKVLYRQVLDLYSTSSDYNSKSKETIKFFKVVQNKLHYASHGNTASEVIVKRADAGKPFMGLLTFTGTDITKKDVIIAKNYLSEKELKILNNIVSAYFDMAEIKAMNEEIMNMSDWVIQLDKLIELFDKDILTNSGLVSHKQAMEKVDVEYKKYQAKTLSSVEVAYLENIKYIEKKLKGKK
ncbi:MAG: virulence RhuM family protein [Nanoarchaeales archaeon]|nr:virulence RhuM family protein [Nanoarchaeales archaeon]